MACGLNEDVALDAGVGAGASVRRKSEEAIGASVAPSDVLKVLAAAVRPGMHTLETGAGWSSLAFIARDAHHIVIDADPRVESRIRRWCDELRMDHSRFVYVCATSPDVVPHLEDVFDFVRIGGEQAFPIPLIDFYYLARRLKVGGHMAIGRADCWARRVITRQLALDDNWEAVTLHGAQMGIYRLNGPFRSRARLGPHNEPRLRRPN